MELFQPDDFKPVTGRERSDLREVAARLCNDILNEWLEGAPLVKGRPAMNNRDLVWAAAWENGDVTHQARLVCIEALRE